jgi:hypothetical protein
MRMCPTVPTAYLSGRLRLPRRHRFVLPLQPAPQLGRKLVVALLAHRLQVALVELGLLVHLLVADGTGEVVDAPSLVQGGENIAGDHLIADEAQIAEELVVVSLAVRQTLLLVVAMAEERLLAFGAHEMLYVPVLAQSCDDSLFDWSPTGPTNRYAHLVVTPQTVELVHVVGGEARPTPHLSGGVVQLDAAVGAVEVVRVVHLPPELQRFVVDQSVALVTDVLPGPYRLHFGVALVAEGATGVLNEPSVSQLRLAHLATEALWVPARVHGLDHATDYEAVALAATRSEQDLEVALAVLAVVVLVEDAVLELLEALGANEALLMPQLSSGVDDFFVGFKTVAAPSAQHAVQRHVGGDSTKKINQFLSIRQSQKNQNGTTPSSVS